MKTAVALVALMALAACGSPEFQAGFDKAFQKSATESCTTAAAKAGAPADQIAPYCACYVGKLMELSVQERMKLSPTSPKVTEAVEACRPK